MRLFITLMGKGGVGKSTVSLIMAQYLTQEQRELVCVDTDGTNLTFSRYNSLNVLNKNVLSEDGERADLTRIDNLFNDLLSNQQYQAKDIVIDNGANSFTPVRNYLLNSGLHTMELDITLLIPIVAGESQDSCMLGASDLLKDFGNTVKYIIFENERDGATSFKNSKLHKKFEESGSLQGLVTIPQIDPKSLLGADFNTMIRNSLLYHDLNASDKLQILSKSRLKQYYSRIFTQLESLGV